MSLQIENRAGTENRKNLSHYVHRILEIMPTIFIENKPYTIRAGLNLLQACLELGFNLPYFCWHPAMHSVGACRQCAVKEFRDEKDTKGSIIMACMTAAKDGSRISIEDPEAVQFRKSITEWMMIHHPHDCPVCDEGGECHLQDMVVMTGHSYRRYRGTKRTFQNQDLGPFINHEMNRCIQCYRCLRYYRDFAGGRDFGAFLSHHLVNLGRHENGILKSEFSGNLVEICPTGVFTDKTLGRHYVRKWDLQTAPSICPHCSIGCNTIPGERYRMLRRIRNRYNGEVNGYFLCDRGRYGYEYVNSTLRLAMPLLSGLEDVSVSDEVSISTKMKGFMTGAKWIGIGSPRASLEANFALRTLVGPENFYSGVSDHEFRLTAKIIDILTGGPVSTPSLREIKSSDAVLVLGEDVTNTGPMAAFNIRCSLRTLQADAAQKLHIPEWDEAAIRAATQDMKGRIYIMSYMETRLDDAAAGTYRTSPDQIARLGWAIAQELKEGASGPQNLSPREDALVKEIVGVLGNAKKPLIISGLSSGNIQIVEGAFRIALALADKNPSTRLAYFLSECNSMGLGMMKAKPIAEALSALKTGSIHTAFILENDLFRRMDEGSASAFFKIKTVVLDCIKTPSILKADLALPVTAVAESEGTLINYEGRAQRFYKVFERGNLVKESWRWLRDMAIAAGKKEAEGWITPDDLLLAISQSMPFFETITGVSPSNTFRISGMKIARQSHRYSGRTAMTANLTVHEPEPLSDPDSPFSFSMEGYEGKVPSAMIPRFWSPGWNSVQSVNKFQDEIGGALRGGDPGLRLLKTVSPGESTGTSESLPTESSKPDTDRWTLLLSHHIFGSEELSALSPPIAELTPAPYVAISGQEWKREHEYADLSVAGKDYRLRVKRSRFLPKGLAVVPDGISGLQWAAGERVLLREFGNQVPEKSNTEEEK